NGAPAIDGPRPRMRTVFAAFPSMIKPPIITLSPVCTMPLVDRLTNCDVLMLSASKISIKPTPVWLLTPLKWTVYAPGFKVIRRADSRTQFGGELGCPELGRQGSKPVALICAPPPQEKIPHAGASCQLSFCPIIISPEKSCKNGLGRTPGIKNGAPDID